MKDCHFTLRQATICGFNRASSESGLPMNSSRTCANRLSLFVGFLLILLGNSLHAAPFIEQVDPPVIRRGSVTRVTCRGTDLHQATNFWLSATSQGTTATVVSSSATESTLDVFVPPTTPLGMHGLRLATQSGLSNVHIVLVDEIPISQSVESSTDPIPLMLPCCHAAPCRPEQIDRYAIQVAANQKLSFEVIGSRLGKNYDPVISIRDSTGKLVARRDNDPGLFYDCRFSHSFQTAGQYIVEVRDSRYEGHASWNYVLRIGDFPAANVVVPSGIRFGQSGLVFSPEAARYLQIELPASPRSQPFLAAVRAEKQALATWVPVSTIGEMAVAIETEPNDFADETASIAAVPGTLDGVLDQPGDEDCFALQLARGQALNVVGVSREMGSAADLELVLFDPTGREIRRVDDVSIRQLGQPVAQEAHFSFNAGRDGTHWLKVRDLSGDGGPSFAYRIEITEPSPKLTINSDVARLTVPRNNWQPIPISVTRERLAGPIELELVGAPTGVKLEHTTIPADASQIVCKLTADPAAKLGLATIEVIGRWKSEDGKQQAEAFVTTHPLIDRQLRNKDNTRYAFRDNQLRLPPSLRSKFAVMITPPAPFSVVLHTAEVELTKYQNSEFQIDTKRIDGFRAAINFDVTGGQIGLESESREHVFVRVPEATITRPTVAGTFFNRINARYEKTRVDLRATAIHEGHEVTLFRPFELDVRSAFKPTFEPSTIDAEPGKTVSIRVLANRSSTFQGELTVFPTNTSELPFPDSITLPAGEPHLDFEITIPADFAPRRYSVRCESKGYVGKYEEHLREPNLTINVKKPPMVKK